MSKNVDIVNTEEAIVCQLKDWADSHPINNTGDGHWTAGHPASVHQPASRTDMCQEVSRIRSFKYWPMRFYISPLAMAVHGFFVPTSFDEARDSVECFACGLKLHDWNPDRDTPWMEHFKKKPDCPMMKIGYEEYMNNCVCNPARRKEELKRLFAPISRNKMF